PSEGQQWMTDDGRGTPFIVDKADNVCGLVEPRQLTVPAKVDYPKLLHATAEYKEMVRSKIDPESAKGIEMLARARTRVVQACEVEQVNGGYCSIWKAISRRDGTAIPDVTKAVLKGI
ncbi:MAG: hypothetical protein KDB61_05780, partial [Planctomycetes bacterium]|nr:hypothetical protein [Planctomycetota bacterium]